MSDLPERLDVVAVGPHPDDVELTCGATLALLVKQGYRVGIIDLTSGEPTPRGSEEIRAREAEAARRVLGVHVRVNLGLPNRVLMDEPEGRFRLGTELRRLRPSVLIAMAGRTPAASPDHHQGHLLTEAARFYSQTDEMGRPVRGDAARTASRTSSTPRRPSTRSGGSGTRPSSPTSPKRSSKSSKRSAATSRNSTRPGSKWSDTSPAGTPPRRGPGAGSNTANCSPSPTRWVPRTWSNSSGARPTPRPRSRGRAICRWADPVLRLFGRPNSR